MIEELAVRIPIALGPARRRCTYTVEVEGHDIFRLGKDEWFFVSVAHITDEVILRIIGKDGLQIFFSPNADYRVRASQPNGELLDTLESQLQSADCKMENGLHWRSKHPKIGYKYEVRFRGGEVVTDTAASG